jgi:hypothetical protein
MRDGHRERIVPSAARIDEAVVDDAIARWQLAGLQCRSPLNPKWVEESADIAAPLGQPFRTGQGGVARQGIVRKTTNTPTASRFWTRSGLMLFRVWRVRIQRDFENWKVEQIQ